MKDGRTHLAHKAEHAVDLETGAIVGVTVQDAAHGDTTTMPQTLADAVQQLDQVTDPQGDPVPLADDVVADKGCHSRAVILELSRQHSAPTSASPTAGDSRGTIRPRRATRSMRIVVGLAGRAAGA